MNSTICEPRLSRLEKRTTTNTTTYADTAATKQPLRYNPGNHSRELRQAGRQDQDLSKVFAIVVVSTQDPKSGLRVMVVVCSLFPHHAIVARRFAAGYFRST